MIGIYKITSPSGKVYIGQTTNFTKRKNYYKNGAKPYQIRIYNSLQKYGYDAHSIVLIEQCSIDNLNERERYWQDFYNVISDNGLNCRLTETKDKSGFISEESKAKMSEARKGRVFDQNWIEKLRIAATGKRHTEETKKRMSEIFKGKKKSSEHISKLPQNQKGYKGKKRSEETKLKQSLNSGTARTVYQYIHDLTYVAEYRSCSEAKRQLGISNIGDAALGKLKTAGGFKWRYDKL